ncbi:MAG: molybdate ABC transporter substrate-binding protein [Armatimonadota bacterium]
MWLSVMAAVVVWLATNVGCRRRPTETIKVRGAPALGDAFGEVARQFMASNPDVTVAADFTCPPCLSPTTAESKVDFDVLVSAGRADMEAFVRRGVVQPEDVRDFGTASLVIVLPSDSTLEIRSLADLAREEIQRIDIGDPAAISTGEYARQALKNAGLWEKVSPKLVECKTGCQVLKAVALGEANAGFSYAFCVSGERQTVKLAATVDERLHDPIVLQIGLTQRGARSPAARELVDYVLSADGRRILRRYAIRAVGDG